MSYAHVAVLALPGEQMADQGVMREPYGFGQFSDAVRLSAPRMIHYGSQGPGVAQVISDVQWISIGTIRISIGTVNQIVSESSTDGIGRM
ncbi:hypothetical protein [Streptomyces sp. NBC_01716]|uniref:hypothetical protein n=1 Tax=Streptomyces sp. NBC_01716 TaxID=2975917 RepID=UPI002E315638|nr:hypothetical protein [Streptomyces sp. NBC_01716]